MYISNKAIHSRAWWGSWVCRFLRLVFTLLLFLFLFSFFSHLHLFLLSLFILAFTLLYCSDVCFQLTKKQLLIKKYIIPKKKIKKFIHRIKLTSGKLDEACCCYSVKQELDVSKSLSHAGLLRQLIATSLFITSPFLIIRDTLHVFWI